MDLLLQKLEKVGVLPVIKIRDAEKAEPLGEALLSGGLPAAEITFRTQAAGDAISRMAKAYPRLLIGAGTVLTPLQADEAMERGASFLVSPGFNPAVAEHCLKKGYPFFPGICTPSELECALALGFETVKFFPAEASGGISMLRAMSAPYGSVRFMPTGGITPENLLTYLRDPKVLCCGGSFLTPEKALDAGDFDTVRRLAAETVSLIKNR